MKMKIENGKFILECDVTDEKLYQLLESSYISILNIDVIEQLYAVYKIKLLYYNKIRNFLCENTQNMDIVQEVYQNINLIKNYEIKAAIIGSLMINPNLSEEFKLSLCEPYLSYIKYTLYKLTHSQVLTPKIIQSIFNLFKQHDYNYDIGLLVKSKYLSMFTDEMIQYCLDNNINVEYILEQINDLKIIEKYLKSRIKSHKIALAKNPNLTEEQIHYLYKHNKDDMIRKLLSEHPNCSDSLKLKLWAYYRQ